MSANVTLYSIEIFNTHSWLPTKLTVYFQCKGENKTYLLDVKKIHVSYTFKGEESWQPLTEFPNMKCKRCGFYEEGLFKSDEFDEWEFCPTNFTILDGSYNKVKDKELIATFLCPTCVSLGTDSSHASGSRDGGKGIRLDRVILICVLVSTVFTLGLVASYMFLRKRKREHGKAGSRKAF